MSEHKHDCAEVMRRLDDYLDRELPPAEAAAIRQHLCDCEDCQEEFDVEHELLECIRDRLRRLKAPAGLAEKIAAALAKQ